MNGMLTIRPAERAELSLVHALAWQIFPATYRSILTPEQRDYMMEWMYSPESLERQVAEGHRYYLACLDGEPVGYLSIQQESPDLFHLQKIYLLPACQGKGFGRQLFTHAVEEVRRLHPSAPCVMELNVNRQNPALHFYERMGMTRDREGDFPIGNGYYMNDYIMRLVVGD